MVLYLSDFKNKFKEKKRNFKNLKFGIVNICHYKLLQSILITQEKFYIM